MRRAREPKFVKRISSKPMSEESRRIAEDLLAKFVARLFAEDHPELFRRRALVASPQTENQALDSSQPAAGGEDR